MDGHSRGRDHLAAIILIICAFSAWYMLAAIVLNDVSGRELLKVGKPFIKGE